MKEAWFYEKQNDKKVKCSLCPHHCLIAPGKRGICGVRENQDGILQSLVYGKIISQNVDPIEKKPLFNFLPGSRSYSIATMGCNLRCLFCQNWEISQVNHENYQIIGQDETPETIVRNAQESQCQSIAYTYTEPTIFYEFAYDCAVLAKEKGLKNIFVTNGFIDPEPIEKIAPFLDAANVDLKSFNEKTYHEVCGARLQPILDALKMMKKLKIWIEVTTLVIPELNDSDQELSSIANFILKELGEGVPWHVSAFHPTYQMLNRPRTPAATLERAREIGLKAGLKYVYAGNISIPGAEDTYCPKCRKDVIKRAGFSILDYDIKDGKCPYCGHPQEGVWS
jgi:pyruvate formate lyase activating enzyme